MQGGNLRWGCMLGPDPRPAYPGKRDPFVVAPLHDDQAKSVAMVPWIASAAARGSGASRTGRPTTM